MEDAIGSNAAAAAAFAMGPDAAAVVVAGEDAAAEAKVIFQRAYKACDACRFRKVRCDLGSVDSPLDPPCRRCRRERKDCTFDKGTRGRPKSGSIGARNSLSHAAAAGASHTQQAAVGVGADENMSTPTPVSWASLLASTSAGSSTGAGTTAGGTPTPTHATGRGQMLPPSHHPNQFASTLSPPTGSQHSHMHALAHSHLPAHGPAHHPGLLRSTSAGGRLSGPPPESGLYGLAGGNGAGGNGATPANASDQASDASSPTSRASLALIKLSNSSEAVKALSYVGGNAAHPSSNPVNAAAAAGDSPASSAGGDRSGPHGRAKRSLSNLSGMNDAESYARNAGAIAAAAAGGGGSGAGDAHASTSAATAPGAGANGAKKPRRLRDWRDFEPIRLKTIKVSEAKYLLKYFFQHIHGFSPLCSEKYMANTREVRSELIAREPLLLGAILSVASRFCIGSEQDAAATQAHAHARGHGADGAGVHSASGSGGAGAGTLGGSSAATGGIGPDETAQASFGLELHQRISQWTHQLAGRVLVDCSLHSVGSVEALLLLSEWSTWGIHSDRQDLLAGDDDDDDDEDSDDEQEAAAREQQEWAATAADAKGAARNKRQPQANQIGAQQGSNKRRKQNGGAAATAAAVAAEKKSKNRQHAEIVATTSQRFDSMSWMFVGTAIRLAIELDLPKHDKCFGIYSQDPEEVEHAERRLRVWLDCVRADTQTSIRLGRPFTSGGLSPEWMELMRARTYRLPDTIADPPVEAVAAAAVGAAGAAPTAVEHTSPAASSSSSSRLHGTGACPDEDTGHNRNFTRPDDLVGAARYDAQVNEARKWTAWRGHAELVSKLRNAHDMLNESEARTQSMMENDRFESILRPFRNDLDSWVRWLEPKIGYPGGGMRTMDIRVDYHFTRLAVFRVALDALVLRARKVGRPDDLAVLGEGLSDRPTFPFAKEAVDAARTLSIVISIDIESLRCAPPRFFLYLVLAVLICMQACELSESLMLPLHCASILREAINALNAVAPDERHLARRYALMLRNAGKRLLLAEEAEPNPSQPQNQNQSRLVSDPKLINGGGGDGQHHPAVPTISLNPRAPHIQPPVHHQTPAAAGPSFADDVVAPAQGVDLEDLWSWLGNIDQAVPSAAADGIADSMADSILNFDLLSEGQSAPFFFPNTALNAG